MKLGVNGWRIHGLRTGVGRYVTNLVTSWTPDAVTGRFEEITLYTPRALDPADVPLPESVHERVLRSDWPALVWENARMGPVADDDVLFCPSYTRPLSTRGRTVVTTHDVTGKIYPELYPRSVRLFYNRLYGWSARHATLVITTTRAVRDDVVRWHGVPHAKVRVINLAVDEHFRPLPGDSRVEQIRSRYLGVEAPFFYFVGKLTARRNVPKLIEAFAELKRTYRIDHKLLVVGLNTTAVDLEGLAERFGVSEHVVHHDYISEDDLVLLYNAAEAFIMPSTFETLSLSAMEAQASGTPVISIDTPGLRETTGGAAYLMPEAEIPEMVKAMATVARDEGLRAELADAGLEQAARLSWQRCSAETLAVLEEAAELEPPVSGARTCFR